jgi:UDP-N-acetylmuramate-alanine ligase
MAINKEKMSKLLQVLQKKGNNVQGSDEAVETNGLKKKLKKKKKKDDEEIAIPAMTHGSY